MTSKEFFVKSYGYLRVKLFKYDGLYWFKASDKFLMAVEFLPPEYEPGITLLIDKFDFIKDNIVAAIIDGKKQVFNYIYVKHIEEFKC